ncbi:MAG: hypothetical protein AAGH15_24290 [Myxococcota bacterium]
MIRWLTMACAASAVAAGCASGDGSGPLDTAPGTLSAEPLELEVGGEWRDATPGCEGQLADVALTPDTSPFTIPTAELSLLVVRDAEGAPVCVDSFAAVEQELIELDAPIVDGLWLGYVSALQETDPAPADDSDEETTTADAADEVREAVEAVMGDPHPQPSRPSEVPESGGEASDGDPHPQPSRPSGLPDTDDGDTDPGSEAAEGDPHPQPSRPAEMPEPGDEASDGDPHPQPSRPVGDKPVTTTDVV